MLFGIVFGIVGYRRAKLNGKNGFFWAFLAAGVCIVTQIVFGLVLGSSLFAFVLSFVAGFVVLDYIDKSSQENSADESSTQFEIDEDN